MECLPYDVLAIIVSYLDSPSRKALKETSRTMRATVVGTRNHKLFIDSLDEYISEVDYNLKKEKRKKFKFVELIELLEREKREWVAYRKEYDEKYGHKAHRFSVGDNLVASYLNCFYRTRYEFYKVFSVNKTGSLKVKKCARRGDERFTPDYSTFIGGFVNIRKTSKRYIIDGIKEHTHFEIYDGHSDYYEDTDYYC